MKKLWLVLVALALAGCGRSEVFVTKGHIDTAELYCQPNEGLSYIRLAKFDSEYESCGYKCNRTTGRKEYTVAAVCNNGVNISKEWTK